MSDITPLVVVEAIARAAQIAEGAHLTFGVEEALIVRPVDVLDFVDGMRVACGDGQQHVAGIFRAVVVVEHGGSAYAAANP